MSYEWKNNLACIATYKVLEGDDKLDQFEESNLSFSDAGSKKMGELRYYPKTTANASIVSSVAYGIARRFVKLVVKNYSVRKESSQVDSSDIISGIASVFEGKNKTICDLAEKVDSLIKFSDEN